jgi:prolyl-tRNA synthetase
MPLGWRVHRKVEQIIREEMDAIGSQEMLAPVLTPAELWQRTGRDGIPELFHLKDRNGRDYVLPLTHEETFGFHAQELQSYRQLPQLWYHFQTKNRDEPRPRGGLLRVREFIMKDSYSFDRDEAGLAKSFELNRVAYERIFERCGIETFGVQAESGMMGGSESIDYLAPSGSGENVLVTCENGDYAADLEIARGIPRAPVFPETLVSTEEVETPGVKTCEALADFLTIDVAATSKAMPVTTDDGTVVLALVRGDDRIEPAKLDAALGRPSRPATDEEIREAFGASGGSLGPVGFKGEVVADEALQHGQFVAGANRDGWHLRGAEAGRDFQPRFADLRESHDGDACPICGGGLQFQTAIEVGHIFKLGTRYSAPLGANFVDEDGQEKPLTMGSYGIGLARTLAAIVEQQHDDNGIIWPASIAPYDVHIVVVKGAEEIGEQAAAALHAAGLDVLLDDRDQRPGEKFADADLIGIPIRITAGKKSLEDGAVDVKDRATGAERRVNVADLGKEIG